ncbi:Transcription termination factor like [Melia azedarach]|uniref:Transcription termination factor like n=1 Tax=Melia azedarach TaxID=155640 RepID=A0ACC1YX56_MELAZ|nr:Transcription termination factor like [Melia azedarach]
MFCLRCKRLQLQLLRVSNGRNVVQSTTHLRFFLHNKSLLVKSFSSVGVVTYDKEKQQKEHSFTVSYLIKSCGLSPEIAGSVSKKVNFETPEKPDQVLGILREYGFTNKHISKLVKKYPDLLVGRAEKTLLPKLEFFHSVGISGADLANILSSNPTILGRSLEKQIIPNYNFLKSLLCNDAKIVGTLKRAVYLHDVEKHIAPNISALRGIGVPKSGIASLVISNPGVLCENSEKFDESVKRVVDMGFNPSTGAFIHALVAVSTTTDLTWEQKVAVYRSWGWSENLFWLAFRKYPRCMTLSVENITAKMDFYVNKMGWPPSAVARVATVLAYSLEKRIIPRCSVIRVLQVKGLIKEKFSLSSVVMSSDKYFTDTFVSKYQNQVPQLLNIFQGKTVLLELGIKFEQKSEVNVKQL